MSEATIKIEGLDELVKALEKYPVQMKQGMRTTTKGALEILRGEIAQYPSASAANRRPGVNGRSWYERGYGTRTVTGRGYPTSEMLGRSWVTRIEGGPHSVLGTVGTNASYAPYVQDRGRQSRWHKRRGWKTIQDAVKAKATTIKRLYVAMARKLLARMTR